jgi:hypothetical protein
MTPSHKAANTVDRAARAAGFKLTTTGEIQHTHCGRTWRSWGAVPAMHICEEPYAAMDFVSYRERLGWTASYAELGIPTRSHP